MVAIRDLTLLGAASAASGVTAAMLVNPLEAAANIHERDVTVTVTVTANTCSEVPTPYVPPTSVATTALTVPTGGYSSFITSVSTGTTSLPVTTSAFVPPPVTSVTPPPVVNTTPIESTSSVSTHPTTESVPTTHTSVVSSSSVSTTHASTSSTISISTPPAVNNVAGKVELNAIALALLGVAAFY